MQVAFFHNPFPKNPSPVYALRGSIVNTLNGQRYYVAENQTIDGAVLIESAFHYTTTDKWADLAIVVAWAVAFRLFHYGLLIFNNRHYGESLGRDSRGMATVTAPMESAVPQSVSETISVVSVDDIMMMPLSAPESQRATTRFMLYPESQPRKVSMSVV